MRETVLDQAQKATKAYAAVSVHDFLAHSTYSGVSFQVYVLLVGRCIANGLGDTMAWPNCFVCQSNLLDTSILTYPSFLLLVCGQRSFHVIGCE
jgi:hypothetical protein